MMQRWQSRILFRISNDHLDHLGNKGLLRRKQYHKDKHHVQRHGQRARLRMNYLQGMMYIMYQTPHPYFMDQKTMILGVLISYWKYTSQIVGKYSSNHRLSFCFLVIYKLCFKLHFVIYFWFEIHCLTLQEISMSLVLLHQRLS